MSQNPDVKYEAHPRGNTGAKKSIRKTVQAAAAGRLSPKVGAEAQRILKEAGVLQGSKYEQAKALHQAMRWGKASLPDPVDAERIIVPDCLLADCDGLSFEAGDCDDKSASLAGMAESVGIVCAIVGQAFDASKNFQHILVACEVEDGVWYYADSFDQKLEFGEAVPPTREIWALVPSGRILCDNSSCIIKMQGEHPNVHDRPLGDGVFVGSGMTGDNIEEEQANGSEPGAPSLFWTITKGVLVLGVLGLAGVGAFKLTTGE